jgi:hypothetical protein
LVAERQHLSQKQNPAWKEPQSALLAGHVLSAEERNFSTGTASRPQSNSTTGLKWAAYRIGTKSVSPLRPIEQCHRQGC